MKVGTKAFVLLLSSSLTAAGAFRSLAQDTREDQKSTSYRVGSVVHGRTEIATLTNGLKLGERNIVPIQLHGFKVHSADLRLRYHTASGAPLPIEAETEIAVRQPSEESSYFEVRPERLGRVDLLITIRFEDGAEESAECETKVILPDREPKELLIVRDGSGLASTHDTINLDLTQSHSTRNLFPLLDYGDGDRPVRIPAEDVKFSVISAGENDRPISVDESGLITALHLGDALVCAKFHKISTYVCVNVREQAHGGGPQVTCRELMPPGAPAPADLQNRRPPSEVKGYARPVAPEK